MRTAVAVFVSSAGTYTITMMEAPAATSASTGRRTAPRHRRQPRDALVHLRPGREVQRERTSRPGYNSTDPAGRDLRQRRHPAGRCLLSSGGRTTLSGGWPFVRRLLGLGQLPRLDPALDPAGRPTAYTTPSKGSTTNVPAQGVAAHDLGLAGRGDRHGDVHRPGTCTHRRQRARPRLQRQRHRRALHVPAPRRLDAHDDQRPDGHSAGRRVVERRGRRHP